MNNKFFLLGLIILIIGWTALTNGAEQTIPADSKFSKISLGMGNRQVIDLIGNPNDQESVTTGKAHIPFYRGDEAVLMIYYYKGEGKITFNSKHRIIEINYDPSASGYR